MMIHRSQLHAVAVATSEVMNGYDLNSLAILPDGRCVSTDGHRLVVISQPEGMPDASDAPTALLGAADVAEVGHDTLIPADAVKRLLTASKPSGRCRLPILEYIGITPSNGAAGKATATDLSTSVSVDALSPDSTFPDITRVIPASDVLVSFDPAYMADICKAAIAWAKDAGEYGRGAMSLSLTAKDATSAMKLECGAFVAVLMPRRT